MKWMIFQKKVIKKRLATIYNVFHRFCARKITSFIVYIITTFSEKNRTLCPITVLKIINSGYEYTKFCVKYI